MKVLFFMLLDLENCLNWLNCFEAIPQISSLTNQHFYHFPLTCIVTVPHFGVGHSGVGGVQLSGSVTFTVLLHEAPVTASVNTKVKVAPPPAEPGPKVNSIGVLYVPLIGVTVVVLPCTVTLYVVKLVLTLVTKIPICNRSSVTLAGVPLFKQS